MELGPQDLASVETSIEVVDIYRSFSWTSVKHKEPKKIYGKITLQILLVI